MENKDPTERDDYYEPAIAKRPLPKPCPCPRTERTLTRAKWNNQLVGRCDRCGKHHAP